MVKIKISVVKNIHLNWLIISNDQIVIDFSDLLNNYFWLIVWRYLSARRSNTVIYNIGPNYEALQRDRRVRIAERLEISLGNLFIYFRKKEHPETNNSIIYILHAAKENSNSNKNLQPGRKERRVGPGKRKVNGF